MKIFVAGLQGRFTVELQHGASLGDLKEEIADVENCSSEYLLLFASGKPLDESVSLESLNGVTVDVSVPLKGGKVHGSLARAGKVRGQTPKVEPQEKKKKKTGRAKRRIQYNRRFVNVVATFGRKRGPNANS